MNLIGEVSTPGTYTVSSLSAITIALYAAGGTTIIGSYRKIELIRRGKTESIFDFAIIYIKEI
ncbi:MAG: hypothetical protein Q7U77_11055 [Sediminibacterium sp.]|uniref:SLBB domain-containing protein n=1 Tax=Sediminibacterium sp. TaxID=1917865 RepID=UPI002727A4BF|nr:SLBB domain-containing protein [Sediminibacterium sp.]MDO8997155.1 hypothetical protein [Sediminibacterium sp.]